MIFRCAKLAGLTWGLFALGLVAGAVELRHAENLEIEATDYGYFVRVRTPGESAGGASTWTYALHRGEVPGVEADFAVRIPVERVVTLSTTYLSPIVELGALDSIVGVASFKHPFNRQVRGRIEAGRVGEVGMNASSNIERLVELRPDVVFTAAPYGADPLIRQLAKVEVTPGVTAAYLEGSPLARAEWVKFFGAFYDQMTAAVGNFEAVEARYMELAALTADLPPAERPVVATDAPWGDTWWVAGGDSYIARLIEDAGGRYLWDDNAERGGSPMSFERAYLGAMEADFWINPGAHGSLDALIAADRRFRRLPAVAEGRVYNNDRRLNAVGGNDMWERGIARPDEVLADLIAILHPELLPGHAFIFYQQLK